MICELDDCDREFSARGRKRFCTEEHAQKAYQAAYRAKNRALLAAKMAERRAAWTPEEQEISTAYQVAYRKTHREWLRQQQRDNRDALRIKDARWRAANPERAKAIARARRARKRSAAGDGISAEEWLAVLEWAGHRCLYCQSSDLYLTLDHVVPLALDGWHDVVNAVPACFSCNASKGATPVEIWMPEWTPPWWVHLEAQRAA